MVTMCHFYKYSKVFIIRITVEKLGHLRGLVA